MEQIEKIIQLVTDRLMDELLQTKTQITTGPTFTILGKSEDYIVRYYKQGGYQNQVGTDFDSPEVLVITEMPLFMLTRLSHLTPNNPTEEAILNRLLKQQPIIVLEEGIEYMQKKSHISKSMIPTFEKAKLELQKWGVKFVQPQYFQNDVVTARNEQVSTPPKKKQLITARTIQSLNLHEGDIFEVTPHMIVTALAKDYLKDQNILIEKRDA
ncbi:hypothetical protein BW727_100373 [Jeotgalibaca dankookensis]|uniref:Ethanolamine utilization protein n=1 Tax=Jeotgalibaca dankookensis TaxID=708126 RepID=A0A1S6IMK3_9LACT|nr:hypothetical protein [Jeotgalibaca dankookensis]AQS52766.1 hypothetical protein BW727_100373 [Jeotgalibaca dankookensis]